jgi:rod shape-determining protein MreD
MAGYTVSDQLRLMIPGVVALFLLLLCALPMALMDVALTPHVVWLMTLCVASLYPQAWTVVLAFVLGLMSDFLYGTPLGAQALLSLFLTLFVQSQSRRTSHQLFQLRWLEAAAALAVLHVLLWVITGFVLDMRAPFKQVALGALVSAFWFPVFFFGSQGLVRLLPARN